jgi:hypothetical protein
LVLSLKEGLVECATVCVKSEVILVHSMSVQTSVGKKKDLLFCSGLLNRAKKLGQHSKISR